MNAIVEEKRRKLMYDSLQKPKITKTEFVGQENLLPPARYGSIRERQEHDKIVARKNAGLTNEGQD